MQYVLIALRPLVMQRPPAGTFTHYDGYNSRFRPTSRYEPWLLIWPAHLGRNPIHHTESSWSRNNVEKILFEVGCVTSRIGNWLSMVTFATTLGVLSIRCWRTAHRHMVRRPPNTKTYQENVNKMGGNELQFAGLSCTPVIILSHGPCMVQDEKLTSGWSSSFW